MRGLHRHVSWNHRTCANTYFGQAIPDSLHVLSECGSQVGHGCRTDMISDHEEDKCFLLRPDASISEWSSRNHGDILWLSVVSTSSKKTKIDFEHSLEKTHVRTIIQSNLMFPVAHRKHRSRLFNTKRLTRGSLLIPLYLPN